MIIDNKLRKKLLCSTLLASILLIILLPALNQGIFGSPLFVKVDTAATAYIDKALLRASAAYALARTFNATASVLQESELQLEPAGIGVSLAIGQALDPVNDLVERFSWLMLASLTSLGIQKVLIELSPWLSVEVVLVFAVILLLPSIWLPRNHAQILQRYGKILLMAAFLIRFAIPMMAWMNYQVYDTILDKKYQHSMLQMKHHVEKLEGETNLKESLGKGESEETGLLAQAKSVAGKSWNQTKNILQLRSVLESVKSISSDMVDKIIALIVVFVVSTMVLPIIFLWGIIRLGRLLIGE